MTVLSGDTFNRADGGLGANWTTITGLAAPQIVSNVVQCFAVASDSAARYTGLTWPNDQWSEIQYIANVTNAGGCEACVRMSPSAATFYSGGMFATTGFGASRNIRIERWTAGTPATIVSGTVTVSVNDIFRLEVIGTSLALKKNGSLVLSVIDSNIASGSAGIFVSSDTGVATDHQLDNWQGGDFSPDARLLGQCA